MTDPLIAEKILTAGAELIENPAILGGFGFLSLVGVSIFLTKLGGGGRSNEIGKDVKPGFGRQLKDKAGN